ncbi:hypothetical protein M2351_006496 [Azospirillum canadense]|nr:hypothetical protein [Azospirillum canadense]
MRRRSTTWRFSGCRPRRSDTLERRDVRARHYALSRGILDAGHGRRAPRGHRGAGGARSGRPTETRRPARPVNVNGQGRLCHAPGQCHRHPLCPFGALLRYERDAKTNAIVRRIDTVWDAEAKAFLVDDPAPLVAEIRVRIDPETRLLAAFARARAACDTLRRLHAQAAHRRRAAGVFESPATDLRDGHPAADARRWGSRRGTRGIERVPSLVARVTAHPLTHALHSTSTPARVAQERRSHANA